MLPVRPGTMHAFDSGFQGGAGVVFGRILFLSREEEARFTVGWDMDFDGSQFDAGLCHFSCSLLQAASIGGVNPIAAY